MGAVARAWRAGHRRGVLGYERALIVHFKAAEVFGVGVEACERLAMDDLECAIVEHLRVILPLQELEELPRRLADDAHGHAASALGRRDDLTDARESARRKKKAKKARPEKVPHTVLPDAAS
jgi:hypothetical protein